jgi:hypothetical protein
VGLRGIQAAAGESRLSFEKIEHEVAVVELTLSMQAAVDAGEQQQQQQQQAAD